MNEIQEIIGKEIKELQPKQCKEITNKKEKITKLGELIQTNKNEEIGKFIYTLADNDKTHILLISLLPSLIYRMLCKPSNDISVACVHAYNSLLKKHKTEENTFPFMSTPSIFYQPSSNKIQTKLTKQNLITLEEVKKNSELDEKLNELKSMKFSAEEKDVMIAFLMRIFCGTLLQQKYHVKQLFIDIMMKVITLYKDNHWNLSKFVKVEIAMSLCYLIDDDDLKIDEFFKLLMEFSIINTNYQALLILTQFEEFINDHKNIKQSKE